MLGRGFDPPPHPPVRKKFESECAKSNHVRGVEGERVAFPPEHPSSRASSPGNKAKRNPKRFAYPLSYLLLTLANRLRDSPSPPPCFPPRRSSESIRREISSVFFDNPDCNRTLRLLGGKVGRVAVGIKGEGRVDVVPGSVRHG